MPDEKPILLKTTPDEKAVEYKLAYGICESNYFNRRELAGQPIRDNSRFYYDAAGFFAKAYLPDRVTLTSEQLRSAYENVPDTVTLYVKMSLTQ